MIPVSALPLTGYVILGKVPHLSRSLFLIWNNEAIQQSNIYESFSKIINSQAFSWEEIQKTTWAIFP